METGSTVVGRMMRLIFAGTPATAVPVLDKLSTVHDVRAVLTRPPAPQGRSSKLVGSPVEMWARSHDVEVLAPENLNNPDCVARIREIAPDCCPVVAYGGLITRELLGVPAYGWINLHYSLLPAYRGAAPVQRALLDGCTSTGVTAFRLVPALDAGPVYLQKRVEIGEEETAGELLNRLSALGADVILEALDLAGRGIEPVDQPHEGVSLAPKITPEEARVNLGWNPKRCVDVVRAMSPDPGAWAKLESQRFKILRARIVDEPGPDVSAQTVPGSLYATKRKLYCRVGDGWIELVEVQAPGKKPMPGPDWARGAWKGEENPPCLT